MEAGNLEGDMIAGKEEKLWGFQKRERRNSWGGGNEMFPTSPYRLPPVFVYVCMRVYSRDSKALTNQIWSEFCPVVACAPCFRGHMSNGKISKVLGGA